MDVAIDPGFRHGRRIGPNIAAVTVRQIQHEEVRLTLHATDHHHRLAEIGLSVAGWMRQRHKHLLAALFTLAHVVLDDRVAAGKSALVPEPIEHPLGRVALLARHPHVLIKPVTDRRNKCVQLGPPDR